MSSFDGTDFFTDASLVNDPHPYFEHLRKQGPAVMLSQQPVVAVVGYDEALAVYRDDERFSAVNAATGPFGLPAFKAEGAKDIGPQIEEYRGSVPYGALIVCQDPPSHAKTRALLMGMITPKRLKENEDFMWRLSDRQIDEFIDRGAFNAVADYASLRDLGYRGSVGVPSRSPELPKPIGTPPGQLDGSRQQVGNNPLEQVGTASWSYISDRHRTRSDVLRGWRRRSTRTEAPRRSSRSDDRALRFGAGQDTTVRLLAAALRFSAEDPELQQTLRKDRWRIPDFLEEALRLEVPVTATSALPASP